MSEKKVTKKDLIKDLKEVQKEYKKHYPNSILDVTRNFYRKHGKYKDKHFEELFGNFTNFRNEALPTTIKYNRDQFKIIKKGDAKKYIVSSIVAGAAINSRFYDSLINYCNINNCELVLLVMRGVHAADEFTEEEIEKYKKHFATEFVFNSNLRAIDCKIAPQQILPLTGLRRYASSEHSTIIAATKQFLDPVAQKIGNFPKLIYSTGTISLPYYSDTRQGRIGELDNKNSALIVEIRNEKIFHIRNIEADFQGGFQDIDTYYSQDSTEKIPSEAISIEPHYGIEDEEALIAIKEMVKVTNCKRLFLHDVIDNRSVNPHERKKNSSKKKRSTIQQTLNNELNYLGTKLIEWNEEFPELEIYVVPSNHDQFINRWLDDGEFIKDEINEEIGCELRLAQFREENIIEYYMNTRFPDLKNTYFLTQLESYKVDGVELNMHGHSGKNGGKGSKATLEEITGKCTVGHFHYPLIYRGVFVAPCACKLIQDYNSNNGGSSWLHGAVMQHKNGFRQMIITVNGFWRL